MSALRKVVNKLATSSPARIRTPIQTPPTSQTGCLRQTPNIKFRIDSPVESPRLTLFQNVDKLKEFCSPRRPRLSVVCITPPNSGKIADQLPLEELKSKLLTAATEELIAYETNSVFFSPTTTDDTLHELDTPTRVKISEDGLDSLSCKPYVLGRGGFGAVIKASHKGQAIALKIIRKDAKRRHSIDLTLRSEHNALELVHPYLVKTINIFNASCTAPYALVMMEFIGGRNLRRILEDSSEEISIQRRYKFSKHIARALHWCHSRNLIHLDVKPANVMVNENDLCKLGDFGCSRNSEQKGDTLGNTIMGGTVAYRAPELFRKQAPCFSSDVYSFGVTLWQLLTRQQPFLGMDPHVIIYKVVTRNTRPPCPPNVDKCDSDFVSLYKKCWVYNTTDRPSMDEVLDCIERL